MKQRFLSRRVLAAVCVVALLGAAFRATGIVCYWDCNDDDDFLCDTCSCPPGHGVGGRGGRGGHAGGGGSGGFPGLSDGAMPIPGDCADCAHTYGMPVWRVSEPFVNLWVEDEPLRYQPGYGPAVRVRLAYRYHSQEAATLSTNVFNVGMGWNCSLLSFVDSPAGSTTKRVAYPGGGAGYYVPGGASDCRTNWKLEQTLSNSVVVAFTLIKTDGSRWVYAHQVIDPIGSRHRYFLTEMKDPAGEKLSLVYSASYASNGVARLLSITDATGQSTTIHYATNQSYSPNLIARIEDPHQRSAQFEQDSSTGALTAVVDSGGLRSEFDYTATSMLAMRTPYGTTWFECSTVDYQRYVEVTEPDGSRELFVYRNDAPGVPSQYGQVPSTSLYGGNLFENSELHLRNTFHWNRQQRAALTNDVFSLTTNDFKVATMKHWLKKANGTNSATLSLVRLASPDGVTEGLKTWYDYSGKTNQNIEGTQILPLYEARLLPDGSSWFERSARNGSGNPTEIATTWTTNGAAGLRTRSLTYAANGIDLITETSFAGTQVSSNLFDSAHRVIVSFDALGQTNQFFYHGTNGHLAGAHYASGLVVTNYFNASGFIERTLQGQMSGGSFSPINTNAFTYHHGLVRTHTDPRGLTVTNTWDGLQRLTRVDYPDGTYREYRYSRWDGQAFPNSSGGSDLLDVTGVRDRMGQWTTYALDSVRRVTHVTNALGGITGYLYCDCGSPSYEIRGVGTALAETNYFVYDYQGRRTMSFWADGSAMTNVYDTLGRVAIRRDAFGSVTNVFNNQGLRIATSNAFGRVEQVLYDVEDQVIAVTNAWGTVTTMAYDNLGRLTARAVTGTGAEQFYYDARGMSRHVDGLNKSTYLVHDVLGRKVAETNANQEVVQFSYNGAGDLLYLVDAKSQLTIWNYDPYGQVTNKLDDASNVLLAYAYDANGRLTNRWSAAKGTTAYRYDATGNLTNVDYPASTDLSFAYDALGRLTNMIDAAGTSGFSYYSGGALQSEDGPWVGDAVVLGYTDRLRASLSVASPNGPAWIQGYAYDAARRLASTTGPMGLFSNRWHGASLLLTNLALPNGCGITNVFDATGRWTHTGLTNGAGALLNRHSYVYNNGNQRTKQTRVDGSYVDYTYDGAGQLITATGKETAGTTRLNEKLGYAYDAAGNLQRRTNNALIQTLNVNDLNQLTTGSRSGTLTVAGTSGAAATSVTVNGSAATRYGDGTFAREGLSLSDGNNSFTAIAQDNLGRMATNSVTVWLPSSPSWTYDTNGNLTGDGKRVFGYDDENQLIWVYVTNSWKSGFTYDGKLRRRERAESTWVSGTWKTNVVVRYIYDGMRVVQERHFQPQVSMTVPSETVTYTRGWDLSASLEGAGGIGGLLARTDSSGTAYYHADGNGNVTALVNTSQAVVARYLYDPFGNTLSASGPLADANLYRFSSKEMHANSGLYYYGYRFYEPNLQRWVNLDPIDNLGFVSCRTLKSQQIPRPKHAALFLEHVRSPLPAHFTFVANAPIIHADFLGLALLPETDATSCMQNCLSTRNACIPGFGYYFKRHALTSSLTGASGLLCAAVPNPFTCILFIAAGIGEWFHYGHSIGDAQETVDEAKRQYWKCLRKCAEKWRDWEPVDDFKIL